MSRMRPSAAGLWARCTMYALWRTRAVPGCVSPRPIWMRTGSCWYLRARALIRAGIVAENSTVWRSSGVACRIESMSSAKPMSSISSASSRITVRMAPRLQRAAADVVERPARRGHDDVHAAIERLQLPVDRLAAVDRRDLHAEPAAVLEDGFADLHGQLAGRHEDERERHDLRGGVDHLQHRAGRTPRSCRCRLLPGRAGHGRRAGGGWSRVWIGVGSS